MSDKFDPSGSFVSLQLQNRIMSESKHKDDLIDLSSPEIDYTDKCDAHHLLRYSELIKSNLESKPITEKMDYWYLDLKKNFQNEFDKLRLQFLEEAQQIILHEKQIQIKDYIRLNQDIKIMREMLNHYESTIYQKDQTEKNLNKALDLLYNKIIIYHRNYECRVIYIDKRRQEYFLSLAKHFYEEKIKRKVLINWKKMIEREWKKYFELTCEKKLKVIHNEYKLKYKQLELKLLNANEELNRLRINKNQSDETVKNAFMRGVCVLNMEAMSVLLKDEHEEQQRQDYKHKDNESTISFDEQNKLNYRHHTYPTHVYKPNTIYQAGEARSICPNNHHRHVTFHKHQSTSTYKQ